MGKHCSKRGTFAGVLTLKWRTQEIPGMHGPSALRSRRLMCCHGHIVSGMAKEGGGQWMCRRAITALDCIQISTPGGGQSPADPCIFLSDHQACQVFSQNCSRGQGKGIENFSGEDTREMNAKGIGRALFQTWPGAAEAPVAATADTGMWVHSCGKPL